MLSYWALFSVNRYKNYSWYSELSLQHKNVFQIIKKIHSAKTIKKLSEIMQINPEFHNHYFQFSPKWSQLQASSLHYYVTWPQKHIFWYQNCFCMIIGMNLRIIFTSTKRGKISYFILVKCAIRIVGSSL